MVLETTDGGLTLTRISSRINIDTPLRMTFSLATKRLTFTYTHTVIVNNNRKGIKNDK